MKEYTKELPALQRGTYMELGEPELTDYASVTTDLIGKYIHVFTNYYDCSEKRNIWKSIIEGKVESVTISDTVKTIKFDYGDTYKVYDSGWFYINSDTELSSYKDNVVFCLNIHNEDSIIESELLSYEAIGYYLNLKRKVISTFTFAEAEKICRYRHVENLIQELYEQEYILVYKQEN